MYASILNHHYFVFTMRQKKHFQATSAHLKTTETDTQE